MKTSKVRQCEHEDSAETDVMVNEDFLRQRRVFLFQELDEKVAFAVIYQLHQLNDADPDAPIDLYINCPGGEAYACESILCVMNLIHAPVNVICAGKAFSAAFTILVCATGLRTAYEYAQMMMHQPMTGGTMDATEARIQADELERLWANLIERFHMRSGRDPEKIRDDMKRDHYLTAKQAAELGYIDGIIYHEHQRSRIAVRNPLPTDRKRKTTKPTSGKAEKG